LYQVDVARNTKGAPRLPPIMEAVIHPAAELRVEEDDGLGEGGRSGGMWMVWIGVGGG